MQALIAVAEEHASRISGEPWMYGAFALGVLVVALFAVTRLNSDR